MINLQTTLRDILRLRPRAVEVFDIATGMEFWSRLDQSLEEFCRDRSLDLPALLYRLANLPRFQADRDWSHAPLYGLVDLLADDHRHFREQDLPRIERHLAQAEASDFPPGFPLEEIRVAFHSFKIDFLLHMNEEEEFLFPRTLRTEASVAHPELSPETFRGSVGAYSPVMLHTPEYEIKDLIASLVRKANGDAPTPALESLRHHLEDFAARVVRHADLETGVLMPRALAMEKLLHRRSLEEDRTIGAA